MSNYQAVQADPGNNAINSEGAYQIASDKVVHSQLSGFYSFFAHAPVDALP
jgi:hypothetical protein